MNWFQVIETCDRPTIGQVQRRDGRFGTVTIVRETDLPRKSAEQPVRHFLPVVLSQKFLEGIQLYDRRVIGKPDRRSRNQYRQESRCYNNRKGRFHDIRQEENVPQGGGYHQAAS